jgi:hypothetical protein
VLPGQNVTQYDKTAHLLINVYVAPLLELRRQHYHFGRLGYTTIFPNDVNKMAQQLPYTFQSPMALSHYLPASPAMICARRGVRRGLAPQVPVPLFASAVSLIHPAGQSVWQLSEQQIFGRV